MPSTQLSANVQLFPDYARQIEDLSKALSAQKTGPISSELLIDFADILGVGEELSRMLAEKTSERQEFEEKSFGHFSNNVALLIQKTWIEKADENLRDELLDKLNEVLDALSHGNYAQALKLFVPFADDLAYLLFGAESRKGDFIAFIARIDPLLALFWVYVDMVSACSQSNCDEFSRTVLLVALLYLASF